MDRAVIADACAFIERCPRVPSVALLAARAGMPPGRFLSLFRRYAGVTPHSYAESMRARRWTGASGAGELIRVAVTESRLGPLLLAASVAGVCFLGFGEPAEALRGDLHRRLPHARVMADEAGLAGLLRGVEQYLAAPPEGLALPLDLRGSPWQLRVWQALCAIPPGETCRYGDLACAIGVPRAVRAVARACARNPVSLGVPCHRMVARSGDLCGYRWGLNAKQALLAWEGGAAGPAHTRCGTMELRISPGFYVP